VLYVEDKRHNYWAIDVKTKVRDIFGAGIGALCDDNDDETYILIVRVSLKI
jgi:hypothetical protein